MTQAQIDAKRAAYIANLNLEAELEDRNLQAVKLNQRTGQTAPVSDMRTLEEKLQDVEKLKTSVRHSLLTITDPANATAILSGLKIFRISPLMCCDID